MIANIQWASPSREKAWAILVANSIFAGANLGAVGISWYKPVLIGNLVVGCLNLGACIVCIVYLVRVLPVKSCKKEGGTNES